MADAGEPIEIQVPSSWVGVEDLPITFANAFVGIVAPHEIFFNIGSFSPPAITGATSEEREQQVRSVGFIPIKPLARLALTPKRLDELISALQNTRTNYETLMTAMENQDQS
jgi:hypothetical protein